jgi:hypothetical protein
LTKSIQHCKIYCMSSLSCSPEEAAAWERIVDISEPEEVPRELDHAGGFRYFIPPYDVLGKYQFGGFTEVAPDESGELTSYVTMLVSSELPAHLRGFIVAHLLRHKLPEDVHDPHMCVKHDSWLQHEILDREASLLDSFYRELFGMYRDGLAHKRQPQTELEIVKRRRYERAFANAKTRGGLIAVANEARLWLSDSGLELPDGEVALVGRNTDDGNRWFIKLDIERGKRGHTCKNCSQHIDRGTQRITTVIEDVRNTQKYTHHHFHPGCFSYVELARFKALNQVDSEEVPRH